MNVDAEKIAEKIAAELRTQAQRKKIPVSQFANVTTKQKQKVKRESDKELKGKTLTTETKKQPGSYPIDTPGRARAALHYSKMHGDSKLKARVESKVRARAKKQGWNFPSLGVEKKSQASNMLLKIGMELIKIAHELNQ